MEATPHAAPALAHTSSVCMASSRVGSKHSIRIRAYDADCWEEEGKRLPRAGLGDANDIARVRDNGPADCLDRSGLLELGGGLEHVG
eukprot:scaffold82599_cov33-Tisochrysis_lutea.AAC.5